LEAKLKPTFTLQLLACVAVAFAVLAQDTPDAVDDWATTMAGTSVRVDVLANDESPDGDVVDIVAVTQPANGIVTVNSGQATLDPEVVQAMAFAAYQLSNSVVEAGTPANYPRATGPSGDWVVRSFRD
jgi:hypothetical protein